MRKHPTRMQVLGVLFAGTLLITACGSDDDDGGAASTAAESTSDTPSTVESETTEEPVTDETVPATEAPDATPATTDAAEEAPCEGEDAVKSSFIPSAGFAIFTVADLQGLLAENCIVQTTEAIATPAAGLASLTAGQHQFGLLNVAGIVQAAQQGVELRVVAPGPSSGTDQMLMVPADSDIQDLADLEGKTVGVIGLNSLFQAGIIAHLEEAGIDPNTVTFTLIPVPDAPAALANGTVDATQVAEPFITTNGDAFRPVLADPFELWGDPAPNAFILTSASYFEENPDVVCRMQKAMLAANDLAAEDDGQVVRDAAATFMEVDPAVIQTMGMPRFSSDFKLDGVGDEIDAMVDFGFLEPFTGEEFNELVIQPEDCA